LVKWWNSFKSHKEIQIEKELKMAKLPKLLKVLGVVGIIGMVLLVCLVYTGRYALAGTLAGDGNCVLPPDSNLVQVNPDIYQKADGSGYVFVLRAAALGTAKTLTSINNLAVPDCFTSGLIPKGLIPVAGLTLLDKLGNGFSIVGV
jgi:hypothetical protein